MKFAKDLEESIIQEWAEHYIAYKKVPRYSHTYYSYPKLGCLPHFCERSFVLQLKTVLRECEENHKDRAPAEHKEFFDVLDEELAKV